MAALLCLSAIRSEPQQISSDAQGRCDFFSDILWFIDTNKQFFFFYSEIVLDLGTLLGVHRYPNYRPPYGVPYYPATGAYPGIYPGSAGMYPGGFGYGYGTNIIGNGYGGMGGNNLLYSFIFAFIVKLCLLCRKCATVEKCKYYF